MVCNQATFVLSLSYFMQITLYTVLRVISSIQAKAVHDYIYNQATDLLILVSENNWQLSHFVSIFVLLKQ